MVGVSSRSNVLIPRSRLSSCFCRGLLRGRELKEGLGPGPTSSTGVSLDDLQGPGTPSFPTKRRISGSPRVSWTGVYAVPYRVRTQGTPTSGSVHRASTHMGRGGPFRGVGGLRVPTRETSSLGYDCASPVRVPEEGPRPIRTYTRLPGPTVGGCSPASTPERRPATPTGTWVPVFVLSRRETHVHTPSTSSSSVTVMTVSAPVPVTPVVDWCGETRSQGTTPCRSSWAREHVCTYVCTCARVHVSRGELNRFGSWVG